jgi:5-methylcytosine-specific restriction endonuclease McrA
MNHQKIYDRIVENAKNRKDLFYECEIHHIIPRSIGGSNNLDNLVKLTYKEHYVCHRLLTFIFPSLKEMHFAY